jgi:hypothetical protein
LVNVALVDHGINHQQLPVLKALIALVGGPTWAGSKMILP